MGNIHITDSYKIPKAEFYETLLTGHYDKLKELLRHRSLFSIRMEWAAHNFLYRLGISRDRTASVDLNWPQQCYMRIAYIIVGLVGWVFIR